MNHQASELVVRTVQLFQIRKPLHVQFGGGCSPNVESGEVQ